jgi:hypothetical protein
VNDTVQKTIRRRVAFAEAQRLKDLLRRPIARRPVKIHPENSRSLRIVVLDEMMKEGLLQILPLYSAGKHKIANLNYSRPSFHNAEPDCAVGTILVGAFQNIFLELRIR